MNWLKAHVFQAISAILLAACFGLGITIWLQGNTIDSLREQAVQHEIDLRQCRSNNHTLDQARQRQNTEIQRMRQEGERRDRLLADIEVDVNRLRRSQNILATPGSTCQDAYRLIMENIQ